MSNEKKAYEVTRPELGRPMDKRLVLDAMEDRPELSGYPTFDPEQDVDLVDEINRVVGNVRALVEYANPELGEQVQAVVEEAGVKLSAVDQALADTAQLQAQVDHAVAQALTLGGTTPYATEAQLLAAPVPASGETAWAQDTAQWFKSDGTAWQPVGGGALSEASLGVRVARYRAGRTPTQNAAYLNGLLAGGNVRVILPRREWLLDRSLRVHDNSILEGEATLKFSQIPVYENGQQVNNDTANGRNGLIVNADTANGNRNITLRGLTLDAGNYGSAATKTRLNGWTLMNVTGFTVERVTTRNGTGYGQWHPGSTYGILRDCVSEAFEECFEGSGTTRHVLYDRCRSVGGQGRTATGFLMYAGASHITFLGCRAEGYGNGFNFSSSDGDPSHILMDPACSSDVTGVGVLASGTLLSTYKPGGTLASGYTEASDGTITHIASGRRVWAPDQRLTLDGRHHSSSTAALQSGSGGTPPRGLTVRGEYEGQHQGLLLLGAGGQSPRLRDVRVTVTARGGEASAPACINNDMPLDIDGLTVEIRGEADMGRRKLFQLATGDRVRRVQQLGAPGFVQAYGGARAAQIEVDTLIVGGSGNIIRGGAVKTVSVTGGGNDLLDVEVTAGLSEYGALTGNRYSRLIVPAPATWSVTAAAVVDNCRVGGILRNQNNVVASLDVSAVPDGSTPRVYGGRLYFMQPGSIWTPSGPSDTSGVALWLRASDLALGDGAAVASWTDSSGKARHFTQGTPSAQPTYRAARIGGRPAVQFDGGDWLASAAFEYASSPAVTVLLVIRPTALGGTQMVLESGTNFNAAGYGLYAGGDRLVAGAKTASGVNMRYSQPQAVAPLLIAATLDYRRGPDVAGISVNGVAGTTRENATENPSGTFGAAAHYLGMRGGSSLPFAGDVAEVIILPRLLSDAELSEATGIYLKPRYGFTY